MSELLKYFENPLFAALLAILVLLIVWLVYRFVRRRKGGLAAALAEISFDRLESVIIPNADEGEILIDYLLLTSEGLLVLDVKDVQGVVFGGDKLQDWSVINDERRFTFSNPQPALYDRIAAVREIVQQVPVSGRILFLDGAEFTKGVPQLVTSQKELIEEFGEIDKDAAKFKVEAFKPHWDLIRKEASTFAG